MDEREEINNTSQHVSREKETKETKWKRKKRKKWKAKTKQERMNGEKKIEEEKKKSQQEDGWADGPSTSWTRCLNPSRTPGQIHCPPSITNTVFALMASVKVSKTLP